MASRWMVTNEVASGSLAPVPGQFRSLDDQSDLVQHLQVVADVADRDPQLGGKRPNGTGLARPQRVHEAAPRGMRQGRQHGGVGDNPDGARVSATYSSHVLTHSCEIWLIIAN